MPDKPYKDYTAEDFAGIKDIKERMRAFVLSTMHFYNNNNRSTGEAGYCLYKPTQKNSPGCAIGRFVSDKLTEKQKASGASNFHLLPKWMQEMSPQFLDAVQSLHDKYDCWTDKGISNFGAQQVEIILAMIATLP